MARSKKDLPGWFPFALLASGLIAVAAGMKSNWGQAMGPKPTPEPSVPPIKKAGVLQDWAAGDYRI